MKNLIFSQKMGTASVNICDQLNSSDLEKHDKNVSNARKSQLNHIAKSQNY